MIKVTTFLTEQIAALETGSFAPPPTLGQQQRVAAFESMGAARQSAFSANPSRLPRPKQGSLMVEEPSESFLEPQGC